MKITAFSLFDTKTGVYGTPFFMLHVGQAVRAVQDLGNDMNTTIGRHPADYSLVILGEFDDATGAFDNSLVVIGSVVSFLTPRPSPEPLFTQRTVTPPTGGYQNGSDIVEPRS